MKCEGVCVKCDALLCSGRSGEDQRRSVGGVRVSAAHADQTAGRDRTVLQLVRQSQGMPDAFCSFIFGQDLTS